MTEFVKNCHMLLKGLLHFDWHIRIELPWWSPIKRWRAMSHQGHALRQIFVDENWEIVVQKKYAEDDNEDGCFLLIYVTETKCKKYNRRIYTLYSDMGNTDLHRYVLVHFQIDVNYKTRQHLMKIVKNPVNLILKWCRVQLNAWKNRRLARNRSQPILT